LPEVVPSELAKFGATQDLVEDPVQEIPRIDGRPGARSEQEPVRILVREVGHVPPMVLEEVRGRSTFLMEVFDFGEAKR
jgi:hypothetical protein